MLARLLDRLMSETSHAVVMGQEVRRCMFLWNEPYQGYTLLWVYRYTRFAARAGALALQTRERILAVYGDEKEESTRNAIDALLRRNF